ncbi:MAG: hypothetical protein LBR68_04020 [Lachnoclostridium sp.]|nr:hypothetical protein [Lachnoclostridium sp.]
MKRGVFKAQKKDGTLHYRSAITYKGKYISLGSFSSEDKAFLSYCEAHKILYDMAETLDSSQPENSVLSFKKRISLLNYRDNNIYIKTPIYLKKNYFIYYLTRDCSYIFDVDDLFYYSTHSIMRRGGHLFVADYGAQYNILSRYGIKNFAVPGKDYIFVNGNNHDFRYENIEVINRFHGVSKMIVKGKEVYQAKINMNGYSIVGYYPDDITAAVAYNKAAEILIKKGIEKDFPANFIEELQSNEYRSLYKSVKVSNHIIDWSPKYKER